MTAGNQFPREIVAQESEQLLSRDRKYRLVTLPMSLFSKLRPGKGPYLESAYYFARHIDDVLDGDRLIESEGLSPDEYVELIVSGMRNGINGSSPSISRLYEHAISFAPEGTLAREEMKNNFSRLVDVMRFDYDRQKSYRQGNPVLLSRDELNDYYHETFGPALEITSQIIDSKFVSEHVSRFSVALGRMYSICDLSEDLSRGIINIPKEVLGETEADITPAIWLWEEASVQNWAIAELETGEDEFKSLRTELSKSPDPKTRMLFRLLSTGPMGYRKRMSQIWQI